MERSNDVERKAAIETRFRGRVSWLLLGAVVLTRLGPMDVATQGIAFVVVVVLFAWLNLPTMQVVQRARREKVPFVHWRLIAVALAIRTMALALAISIASWRLG